MFCILTMRILLLVGSVKTEGYSCLRTSENNISDNVVGHITLFEQWTLNSCEKNVKEKT